VSDRNATLQKERAANARSLVERALPAGSAGNITVVKPRGELDGGLPRRSPNSPWQSDTARRRSARPPIRNAKAPSPGKCRSPVVDSARPNKRVGQ